MRKNESGQAAIYIALFAAIVVAVILLVGFQRVPIGSYGMLVDYPKGTSAGQPSIEFVPSASWRWVWPWQDLATYPAALQSLTMNRHGDPGTDNDESVDCKDGTGIKVNVDVTVLWRVKGDQIAPLYINYPKRDINQIRDELVRRLARQSVADACGQFGFLDIAGSSRVLFGQQVAGLLGPRLSDNYLEMDEVSIGEIYLEPEQQRAITDKSVAEQQALQAKFLEEQRKNEAAAEIAEAEGDKKAAIIRAQGQAEAAKIITEQLGGREYYIRYLWIEKWNGAVPYMLVTEDGQEFSLIAQLPEGVATPMPTADYPAPTATANP